jgi:hypothetical protein
MRAFLRKARFLVEIRKTVINVCAYFSGSWGESGNFGVSPQKIQESAYLL